jgi:EcsC family protein
VELPRIPPDLLSRLRADPVSAPETIALAAGEVHGPAAERWSRDLRARYELSDRDLAKRAKTRHAALARFGGAATGVGGLVTMVPDLVSLLWIQSRLVFYVAAAHGFDPNDRMRPAELLVLRDLYPDPAAARAGLDGAGRRIAEAYVDRALRGERADAVLATRLLRFAGKRTAKSIAGRAIPGFAVLFNAVSNERDTRRLADRAIAFYGG